MYNIINTNNGSICGFMSYPVYQLTQIKKHIQVVHVCTTVEISSSRLLYYLFTRTGKLNFKVTHNM